MSGRLSLLDLVLPCCTVLSAAVAVAAYQRNRSTSKSGGRREGEHGRVTLKDNGHAVVQSVLSVWFDGSTAENHRTKWFAQGENTGRIDALIRSKFGEVVLAAEAGELTEAWSTTPTSLVALIVVLDQFSRHVFRDEPDRDARVAGCDRRALALTEMLLERGWQHKLTVEQHVFALMPLRHTPSEERLQRVLHEIEGMETGVQQSGELLQRFKKATNRRLQGIQDMAEEDAEILEHFEFAPPDGSLMYRHQLVRVVRQFLDERGFVGKAAPKQSARAYGKRDDRAEVVDIEPVESPRLRAGGNATEEELRTVAVSLSGGVDSMALCTALVHLKPVYGFEVMGIHIDYGNRHESGREADFVEGWCARHGVLFYKRAIAEVRRGVTAREEYEKVARDIRFDAYKAALEGRGCPAVMFGHHEGDVEENVLTNLVKGCSILGLAGMSPENTVNGVRVWRPMLPFGKDVVLDFAHKFGVPYFKDTTPSWSTRGKLRRQLIPMMEDVFGSGVLSHLSAVARESDDLRHLVHRELFQPVWDSAVVQPLGLHLNVEPYRGHGLLFWKEALRSLIHAMGMPMVRDKTLWMFVKDTLQRDMGTPLKDKWVELRKEYVGCLHAGSLYIFRMGAFLPANTSYGEQAAGTPVPIGGDTARVGPWTITAEELGRYSPEELQGFDRGRPPEIDTPPFRSMEELMNGELVYTVALASTQDARLIIQPGERAKVSAWRDIDPRIRRALPLAAPVRSSDAVSLVETGAVTVKITLTYAPSEAGVEKATDPE